MKPTSARTVLPALLLLAATSSACTRVTECETAEDPTTTQPEACDIDTR